MRAFDFTIHLNGRCRFIPMDPGLIVAPKTRIDWTMMANIINSLSNTLEDGRYSIKTILSLEPRLPVLNRCCLHWPGSVDRRGSLPIPVVTIALLLASHTAIRHIFAETRSQCGVNIAQLLSPRLTAVIFGHVSKRPNLQRVNPRRCTQHA